MSAGKSPQKIVFDVVEVLYFKLRAPQLVARRHAGSERSPAAAHL
jgi:hypothetical protein